MAVKNAQFWQSKKLNNWTFQQYYNRLTELAVSMFECKGLPRSEEHTSELQSRI